MTMRYTPLLALLLLASCVAGPDYQRPEASVPEAYKESPGWKLAAPRQAASHLSWWSAYGDPLLDELMAQVDLSNQDLRAREAAFRQARAALRATRADFFPTVGIGGSLQRSGRGGGSSASSLSGRSSSRTSTDYEFSVDAGWELDVWGRVRRAAESGLDTAQATAADLAAARLAAQGDLATAYFQLRAADQQKRLLDAAAVAYAESLRITQNQYNAGVAPRSDVLQAQTQVETARSQSIAVGVQRAQLEHAIALLAGKAPADFAIAPAPMPGLPPEIPAELPSALLERRPDIAAAERRMAAANAQIGIAEAAFFPTVSLSGSGGFSATALDPLLRASNAIWSFGPQLALNLFDGGLRSANVEQARAGYDQTVANYRQTVLTGFQQVEDQLAALRILGEQAEVQAGALRAAREAERLTLNQYRAGTLAFTAVIVAQTAALNNDLTAVSILQNRLTASVALVRALGGGWDASTLPGDKTLYAEPADQRPGFWTGLGTAIRNLVK